MSSVPCLPFPQWENGITELWDHFLVLVSHERSHLDLVVSSKFQAGQHPLPNKRFFLSILQYINQRKKHRERWVGALMSTSVPREYKSFPFNACNFWELPPSLLLPLISLSLFRAQIQFFSKDNIPWFTAGSPRAVPRRLRSFSSPKSHNQGKVWGLEAELDPRAEQREPTRSWFVQCSTGSFPSFV